MRALYICLLGPMLAVACGGAVTPDTTSADAGPGPDVDPRTPPVVPNEPDAGPPEAFPAFKPDAPQVKTFGGAVLQNPKTRAVFFPGFPYAKEMTEYSAKIGASAYWVPISEYGVGVLTSDAPLTLTEAAPAQLDDEDIKNWLVARFDGTHPEWGSAPDPDTIYTLYYPSSTTITLDGSVSCQSFGGYHNDVLLQNIDIAYAVIPDCGAFNGLSGLDAITTTTSHELNEAATDPHPSTAPAYAQVDDNHLIWSLYLGGGETGDLCAQFRSANYLPTDFPFMVQRYWSNKSARSGSDPCAPKAGTEPYFNTAPIFPDKVPTKYGISTKGVKVPVGQSKTIELDLFSDAPTSGPWTVSAQVLSSGGASPVTFAYDKNKGKNGDKINLTITAKTAFTNTTKTGVLTIYSQLGQTRRLWLGVVAN